MSIRSSQCVKLMTIGDWCITKDSSWSDAGIYADHIKGCHGQDTGVDDPIKVGDCCWSHDDSDTTCFYCKGDVPPEIQALVLLQMKM